jgi:CheY-like chemotaxis protein
MSDRCILVIDDEATIREVTKLSLQITRNWRVITSGIGFDGVNKAIVERPDAILLDVMMPGLNGMDVLQSLKSNPETQTIPVILLTAMFWRISVQQAIAQGARGVISKPFDPGILADQIEMLLGWGDGVVG